MTETNFIPSRATRGENHLCELADLTGWIPHVQKRTHAISNMLSNCNYEAMKILSPMNLDFVKIHACYND